MSRRRRSSRIPRPHQHESARRSAHRTHSASDPAAGNPLVPMLRPALRDQDITAFWITAAPLIPLLAEDPGDLPAGVDLLQTFLDVDIAETTALLHVIAAMSPDEGFRQRARAALPTRRQPMPPQVTGLSAAAAGGATVFSDSQGDNLMIELVLPKAVRAVLITYIARDPLPYLKDAFVVGAPLRQVHADYRRIMARDGFTLDDVLEVLSPEQAGAALAEALEATPAGPEAADGGGEQWPMLRPFVEFVGDLLPAGGPGYDEDGWLVGSELRATLEDVEPEPDGLDPDEGRPPWILEDGTDLVVEFLASPQGRDLDGDDHAPPLVTFLFLVASGASGDPLGWTPELSEWVAAEMLPTNPVLSDEATQRAPAVLPALITWAHARTGTEEATTRAVLDVVRPLLEDLPARRSDPQIRARRLEENVEYALETADPDALRYADLAMRVGGDEELDQLDDTPLPTEPLQLEDVPEDLHPTLREIDDHLVRDLDRVAADHPEQDSVFGDEFRTACRRLLTRIARRDPAVLRRRASTRITAGAIAWTVGRGNDLVGHPPAPARASALLGAFGITGSPSQRAETLTRAAAMPRSPIGVALGDPGLLVSAARQRLVRTRDRLAERA
ncbi:hypothetical protein [Brachybacterium vulturis]|uniref:hypothetical protein n=1 Tax=Brachybacterium vulturis TaxID=2017484 RepID=UPI0037365AAB